MEVAHDYFKKGLVHTFDNDLTSEKRASVLMKEVPFWNLMAKKTIRNVFS